MNGSEIEAKLAQFERRLVNSSDFTEAADYFHEHLVTDAEFIIAGEVRGNAALHAALDSVLAMVFGGSELRDLHLIHLALHGLWHGVGTWGAQGMLIVVYSQRADAGLVSVARSVHDSLAHFIRFSVGMPIADN